MMTSGYDASLPPSNYPQFEPRRSSGNIPASYDRPAPGPARQRSMSPGPSRRLYDRYMPNPAEEVPYRNSYRPNNYRPEHNGGSYYDRSPSPDPYGPPRPVDLMSNHRDPAWRYMSRPYDMPDKRPLPPSPVRRFEPNDHWKQSHVDYPMAERSPDRHFHRNSRGSIGSSPERTGRIDRPAFIPGGDRYRPSPPKREIFPPGRSDYDSYRSPYPPDHLRRGEAPASPAYSGHMPRRDSGASGHSRNYDRSDWSHSLPRRPSGSSLSLATPAPGSTWPDNSPPWGSSSLLEAPSRDPPTRQPSRSSIASSHVSDRRSPGLASIPQPSPSIPLPAHLPAKPVAAIDALLKKEVNARTEAKAEVVGRDHPPPRPINVRKESSEKSTKPMQDAVRKTLNELTSEAVKPAPAVQDAPPKPPSPPMPPLTNGAPSSHVAARSPSPSEPPSSASPSDSQSQPSNSPAVEIKQPTPISPVERPSSVRDDAVLDVNIPPPVHSPSHSPDISNGVTPQEQDPILALSTLPRHDEIPPLSSAKTKQEALRIVVMTRLLRDHQSREARIEPPLFANRAIAPDVEVHPFATAESLMERMFDGAVREAREDSAARTRPLLKKFFQTRQVKLDQKIDKLKSEYMTLQDRWVSHCSSLNDQQKTLASEQENQPPLRSTRRSMAVTDAVRSDFEMEQIIASLGNDDATDPNHLSMRNLAKVPDMISAVDGQVVAVFDDNNYRVENPAEYYSPDTGIHDWTEVEKQTFVEKFGAFPKQFGIIADFLPNKTAAQCVAYYYLHKKIFIDFRKIITQYAPTKRRRRGTGRKRGGGLLADIAMHDMEVNRGGGASPASTGTGRPTRGRRSLAAMAATATAKPPVSRRNAIQLEDTPGSTPTPEPESGMRTTRRRKVAAASISSMAGIITTSSTQDSTTAPAPTSVQTAASTSTTLEEEEPLNAESRPSKRAKRSRKIKSAATVVDEPGSPTSQGTLLPANEVDIGLSSKKKDKGASSVTWNDEEKQLFLSLLSSYGNDFKRIAASMPGKTTLQVTNYYKSHQVELNLAEIVAKAAKLSHSPEPAWMDLHSPPSKQTPQSGSRPSSSSLTHVSIVKPPPMSSLGYDPTKNVYPGSVSGTTPYLQISPREGQGRPSSWTGTPLPTRMPPGGNISPQGHRSYGPNGSPQGYPYPPRVPHSPPTLRHSQSALSSNMAATRSPQRPRISTSLGGSSPSLPRTSPSNDITASASAAPPPPPSGSTAIVHSPTIPSPKLPTHQPPPPQPQPHAPPLISHPHPRGEQRPEQGPRYPANQSPVNHHARPRSGSTSSQPPGWRPGTSGFVPRPFPPNIAYRDAPRGPWSGPEMVDPRVEQTYNWQYSRHSDQVPPGVAPRPLPSHMTGRGPPPLPHPFPGNPRGAPPEIGWPADPARRGWYP